MQQLSDHRANVYSQFGEDGILARIFQIIGEGSQQCVEFGAWDGFHLSNTANLWSKQGWKAVLIEADAERFKQLAANTKKFGCRCVHARVGFSGDNTLENILRREGVPGEIDLLSIDIDSDDYYVFQTLGGLAPRVIVCEYNPTIPPEMELVPEPGGYFGCSALALMKLAESKKYKLVAVTESNCIFIRAADFPKFSDYHTDFAALAVRTHLTYLMTGYAGDYLLSRQPTYGAVTPSAQTFAKGEAVYWRPEENKPPAKKRPAKWKPLSALRQRGQWMRFHEYAESVKPIYARWAADFPAMETWVHPVWQEARPAFEKLIQNGLPRDFLKDPTLANQFCRSGFGAPQQHELAYLRSRPPDLWSALRQYRESPVGGPAIDCQELQISANSLGMLYYFARIAERLKPRQPRFIVEFGAGYGCLCRVFWELLPEKPTYVVIDLPEMLALQYVFLQAAGCKVVAHTEAPSELTPGAVHLVPVWLAEKLGMSPDLFVSTFALSETPQRVQQWVAEKRFFGSNALYLVGQEVEADLWKGVALDSSLSLRASAKSLFSESEIQPYHFASAWELFAKNPRSGA